MLDPFLGTGTTALVADRLRRSCTGIEFNPDYAAIAEARLRANLRPVEAEGTVPAVAADGLPPFREQDEGATS